MTELPAADWEQLGLKRSYQKWDYLFMLCMLKANRWQV